ncbi:iron ABC transporter permease [Noviherbaspirillum cavernae]|uniref:Iron ABC transporter permease n=2 Tax=Noviherbaspirillum cavernae TaxID=2320862 RepID=A0A418X5L2_9BURK|nr:iron ABC transporter permease [Noviherbaspirillum cavernae]
MSASLARRHGIPGLRPAPLLLALLLIAAVVSVLCGAVPVSAQDWLAGFHSGELSGGGYVLWNIRLPRALFAILVGAALGISGALTQGLFRNPLADPGLLGVSSGATCAAALTIVVFSGMALPLPPALRMWLLPIAALGGAFLVCMALDRVARWITPGSIAGLLLTGVALNSLSMAVVGLCTYLASDEQLRSLSFWTLGSLAGAGWLQVAVLGSILAAALWQVRRMLMAMNALALGEAAAQHVGINVGRLRGQVVLLVALLTGFAVAWSGLIGFVGLIAPHMVRTWLGADQRQVLPLAGLVGGLLLLVADTVARTIAIPAEIPVGIFTALLGAPFFLFLLRSARSRIG